MKSVGIDIGSYSIKVAEIEPSGKGFSILRFQVIPLSIDPKKDQEIEIIDALRRVSGEYDPTTTKFVVGMKQRNLSLRRLQFPFTEKHKIQKSLAFELEDNIPFSSEECVFAAKITHFNGHQASVLAVACPNENIEKLIQLSKDSLFQLDYLAVDGISLSNLFENWADAPPNIAASEADELSGKPADLIIDFGHRTTQLLVMSDQVIIESRSIDWGGLNIAMALSKKYSTQTTEAIREFEVKSFVLLNSEGATLEQVTYSDEIKKELDKFTHQLNLTLVEIRSQRKLNFVKGSIHGGLSQLKNLTAHLTQKTEIPFKKFNVFSWHPSAGQNYSESEGLVASQAIGLAIEALKRPKNPALNLRKEQFAVQSQTLKLIYAKWSHAMGVAAAIFVFFVVYGMIREDFALTMYNKADDTLRAQASEIIPDIKKKSLVTIKKINDYIHEQQKIEKIQKTTESLQNINSALDLLNEISKAAPNTKLVQLNVKKFKVENREVFVEGEVKEPKFIEQVKTSFSHIAVGGKVKTLNSQVKAQAGWTTFGFQFQMPRLRDEEGAD